jgi:hypothetical protein
MNPLSDSEDTYARRHNQDGTIDSICNRCSLMIARAFNPSHLKELEIRHVCQQMERRGTVRIVYQIYDPSKGPSAA